MLPAARIAAAVLVLRPNPEHSGFKVYVRPVQTKRLPLPQPQPQPQPQSDCPSTAIPGLLRLFKDELNVGHAVRLHFAFCLVDSRRLGHCSRILRDSLTPVSLSQSRTDCPVSLMRRGGFAAFALHSRRAFEVFRLKLVQAVGADTGNEVLSYSDLVCGVARIPDVRPCDVL